jgi:hypothetical protein
MGRRLRQRRRVRWRDVRPSSTAPTAVAARDEVRDAIISAEPVPKRLEVEVGLVTAIDGVAFDPHLETFSDGAADRADLRRAPSTRHPPIWPREQVTNKSGEIDRADGYMDGYLLPL